MLRQDVVGMGKGIDVYEVRVDLATSWLMTEPIPRIVSAINDALAEARVGLVESLLLASDTHTMSL